MDTIFLNSENSKTSKPHVSILKLTDELVFFQILVFTIPGKTKKAHATIINLKYQLQHGMMNLD